MLKKTFLILVVSFFTLTTFAQFGTITVSSNTNQKFWLFIDDVLQNEYSTHAIRLQGLQYTYYRVRVEMDNRDNNCVGQTILITNMPNSNNYVINADRGNYFFGKAKSHINPFFIQNLLVPNSNYYSYYQQYLYPGFNSNANYGQNQYKGSQYKGYQVYYQSGGHGHGGNQGYPPQGPGGHGHGNPPPPVNPPGHVVPPPQVMCMPAMDFNRALGVIQNESFENSKLGTAKQVASNNQLCTSQITQICRSFSHESTKLDFAKYAYRFCVDQNNYYLLNDVFSFSSSKDELRRYIDGR